MKKILIIPLFFIICNAFSEQNTLLIATLEYPPFIYSENGDVKGPVVETVKAVFSSLGVKIKIEIFPIARGLLMVKNGEADAYFSLKRTPQRESDLLFTTTPLLRQPFVFFTRRTSGIKWNGNIEDIKDYRIGVVAKTSYGAIFDGYLKDGLLLNIEETQSFELNIKKLIAGRVDVVINSYDVGLYIIKNQKSENEIISLSPPVEILNSYLAFTKAKDYSALASEFDSALKKIDQ